MSTPDQTDRYRHAALARIILPASRSQFLLAAGISTAVFVVLLLGMRFTAWLPALDLSISTAVQGVRGQPLDRLMVGITMLGDTQATLASMLALLILLACAHRWWLLWHLAAVFLASRFAVPLLKSLIERDRPSTVYGGVDSFSFPSGHATAAMTLFGVITLITIRNIPTHRARWLIIFFAAVVVSVAFSRVYLLAHWPSDVIAGLALSMPFVLAFGWQLQQQPVATSWFTPAVLGFTAVIFALHLWSAFGVEAARYLA